MEAGQDSGNRAPERSPVKLDSHESTYYSRRGAGGYIRGRERNEREGGGRLAIRPLGAGRELLPLLLLADGAAGH